MQRMPWPDYFMSITYLVRERSTCLRRKVGAIAVKDRHILATGYNGAPSGVRHCLETGCLREQMGIPSGQRHEICRGVSIAGAELYCTTFPCAMCSKMLINCGIKHIWYSEHYPDELGLAMLSEAGVTFEQIPFSPDMLKGPQHV